MNYIQLIICGAAAAVSGTAAAAPVTVVSWGGGDYVSNSQPFQGSYTYQSGLDLDNDSFADDSRFGYGLSTTSPLSPASGYSGTNATFYGGFTVNTIDADSSGDTLQSNGEGVHQNGSTDHIKFETQHSGNHHTFAFLAFWDKADFLSGGATSPVTLGPGGSFSSTPRSNSNITEDTHLHFVVRDGTQFYVSEAFWGGTGSSTTEPGYQGTFPDNTTTVLNSATPTWGSWQPYNPSGLNIQFNHGGFETPTFTNITGFGFYIDTLNFTANTNNLEIDGFSVNALLIPEPWSAGLAVFGAFGLAAGFRRRPTARD